LLKTQRSLATSTDWSGDVKVFVIDSHAIFRRGLVASLDVLDRVQCVDEADGVGAACEHAALATADLVILDLSIPGGRELLASLADHTSGRVIACTSDCEEAAVSEAIEAGAIGYLRKETLTQDMLQAAVQAAAVGAAIIGPDMLRGIVRGAALEPTPDLDAGQPRYASQPLSDREQRVLGLIAEGYPTREVAEELAYSERTVKNVLHDVVTKLNVRSRSQAVAHAVRDGLI
jgi:two-component system NarL family response regulator